MITIRKQAEWLLNNSIIIDTETTGLGERDAIVEIAAVNALTGRVLINEVVNPGMTCGQEAQRIHGISQEEINAANSPYAALAALAGFTVCQGKVVTAFNLPFDERMVKQTASMIGAAISLPTIPAGRIGCIMELANRALAPTHAQWCNTTSRFKRLPLKTCMEIAGIERNGSAHRALSDALDARDLLVWLATTDLNITGAAA